MPAIQTGKIKIPLRFCQFEYPYAGLWAGTRKTKDTEKSMRWQKYDIRRDPYTGGRKIMSYNITLSVATGKPSIIKEIFVLRSKALPPKF